MERIRITLKSGADALGLADDAALLTLPDAASGLVASVDSVVEGVHFDLALSTPHDVGWKALTSALSDLAAMGAAPLGALVGLCVPLGQDLALALALAEGLAEASEASGCPIVGGDLSDAPQVTITVTVLGTAATPVTRSGGRDGDWLLVTGPCGASAAGLRLLRATPHLSSAQSAAAAQHRRPVARLAEGALAREWGAHAMIDISDGLALDLHRLADASGLGFRLHQVPVAAQATEAEALGGGEDYELLIALDPADGPKMIDAFGAAGLRAPIRIGELDDSPEVRELDGRPLERLGWQHGG
ncbi:MAG TPA: thiamine-phosphate kinase [Acidimicrobiales bacterium]